ncbi:LPS export ABC transporter periplasmic protein LptC [Parvularcula dongshanensis]|uniref:Lipopolysaccharide export system protein LptC n=1 Tax=Parvularcula dongshanensis TaxID=1173995 RepID=A0A840I4Z2_9PROT|nr:LPS export ABC transporter periplasmic protein LptC [Parvularcula dongshanensis]MBB4659351.1 lipopolysaccharide export system protein LptC [Parvularcula dongshanensis]
MSATIATQSGANAYFGGVAAARRLTPKAAQRHSRLVRNLRLVVPALAAALVVTYALSATPPEVDREFLRQFSDIEASSTEMRLDKPRYVGEDLEGNPFEVSAQAARRNPNTPDLIRLDNPEALRNAGTGDQIHLRAANGALDTQGKTVDLDTDVTLVQGIGGRAFELQTDKARIDLEGRTVTSGAPVKGRSQSGDVEADSLTVYEDEGRAVLEGNVRLHFDPSKTKKGGDEGLRN